jgi:hypothetical protein
MRFVLEDVVEIWFTETNAARLEALSAYIRDHDGKIAMLECSCVIAELSKEVKQTRQACPTHHFKTYRVEQPEGGELYLARLSRFDEDG